MHLYVIIFPAETVFYNYTFAVPAQENEEVKLAYQKLQALVSFIST